MIKGSQQASMTKTGLTVTSKTKFGPDLAIEEIATSGGDWDDDNVQVELDEDAADQDNLVNNQDEQGEDWGDTEIELPPDLVCY